MQSRIGDKEWSKLQPPEEIFPVSWFFITFPPRDVDCETPLSELDSVILAFQVVSEMLLVLDVISFKMQFVFPLLVSFPFPSPYKPVLHIIFLAGILDSLSLEPQIIYLLRGPVYRSFFVLMNLKK